MRDFWEPELLAGAAITDHESPERRFEFAKLPLDIFGHQLKLAFCCLIQISVPVVEVALTSWNFLTLEFSV